LRDDFINIKFVTEIPLKSMIIHMSAAKKSLGSFCVVYSANDVTVSLAWTFITKINFSYPRHSSDFDTVIYSWNASWCLL